MGRLEGQVAIVTGGSRGIGRAVALAFACEGASISVVGAQDQTALRGVGKEICSLKDDALAVMADVSQRAEIDRLVDQVAQRWGRIDVLVNNAGILRPALLEDISGEQWDETMAVHLRGTFNCAQAVLPIMKRQGKGKIISVTAPSALRGSYGVTDYAAAKGGIIAFTRNAANELKPFNSQVNCISPVARTRMTDALLDFRRRHPERFTTPSSQGEDVPPEAVAPAFVFFACSDSHHITGQVLALS
ncbi:MAG: SDR family NAD(P)-dependent oxidoreductase [Candidatus Binatia bacterium]|jgi:3-oxoacyl-[acyl-carrier protein] reductase|nr:SDR family NAD(P)-dependent oxidoreductase [Candidatus Binatia bacterium]